MTTVLYLLPAVLTTAYLIARSVNRRGWAATFDLVFNPEHQRFDGPLPDTSIDYAKRQEHRP